MRVNRAGALLRVGVLLCCGGLLGLSAAASCGDDDGGQNNGNLNNSNNVGPDASGVDAGASDASGGDAGPQNPGHTEDLGGTFHRPGYDDPLTNCTSCHGADLRGGAGPSCYSCHDNSDHSVSYMGVMHRSGSASTCNACHGPNNTGGLGPACANCH